jgi:hypothetical protein
MRWEIRLLFKVTGELFSLQLIHFQKVYRFVSVLHTLLLKKNTFYFNNQIIKNVFRNSHYFKKKFFIYFRIITALEQLVATYSSSKKRKSKKSISLSFRPRKNQRFTILRSPHVDKKSREQFELNTYKWALLIPNFSIFPSLFSNFDGVGCVILKSQSYFSY